MTFSDFLPQVPQPFALQDEVDVRSTIYRMPCWPGVHCPARFSCSTAQGWMLVQKQNCDREEPLCET